MRKAKALFLRRDRRSSTIDEGVEHSNTAVAFLQNVRTGIAERLVRKSAPPTAHPDIVHRANIANHLVPVLRDALTNSRRCLIDRRNADQAATGMYPYAIFRISIAHHGFALHWIKLDEDHIEVVVHQFCSCHLLLLFSPLFSLCQCNDLSFDLPAHSSFWRFSRNTSKEQGVACTKRLP